MVGQILHCQNVPRHAEKQIHEVETTFITQQQDENKAIYTIVKNTIQPELTRLLGITVAKVKECNGYNADNLTYDLIL